MGPHVSEGGGDVQIKPSRERCTFSPDDPKTSMELKLLSGNKNS